jgi:hypothetical protein
MKNGRYECRPNIEYKESDKLVAVCMASYKPKMDLFRIQVESILNQTYAPLILVISDETPPDHPGAFEMLPDKAKNRCLIFRAERRLGFALNFERALMIAPREACLLALADQDDFWYEQKIEKLADNIGDNYLIFSDFMCKDKNGNIISNTQWVNRKHNHLNVSDLVVYNAVAGAALMIKREFLDIAISFPRFQGLLHDHWLALLASVCGKISYHPEPLYDYIQHGDNAIGFNYVSNKRRFIRDIDANIDKSSKLVSPAAIKTRLKQISFYANYILNLTYSINSVLDDRLDRSALPEQSISGLKYVIDYLNSCQNGVREIPLKDGVMECDLSAAHLRYVGEYLMLLGKISGDAKGR